MKYIGGSSKLQNPAAPDVVVEFESKAAITQCVGAAGKRQNPVVRVENQ